MYMVEDVLIADPVLMTEPTLPTLLVVSVRSRQRDSALLLAVNVRSRNAGMAAVRSYDATRSSEEGMGWGSPLFMTSVLLRVELGREGMRPRIDWMGKCTACVADFRAAWAVEMYGA